MMTFNLGNSKCSQPHLFADLAELILAVGYDDCNELSKAKLEHLSKEMPSDLDEESYESDTYLDNCWTLLEYRMATFRRFYPFKMENNRLIWKTNFCTNEQSLYLFLLVCSRLRSFDNENGFRQYAAKAFTSICREVLKSLAGYNAIVRVFDANSDDRKDYYDTDLRKAMKKLAQDMGAHSINESEINKLSSSGDYGLDLIATYDFKDGASGSYSILGQCGAQETDWTSKTLEAHPINLRNLFTLLNEPDNLMFIPLSYRDATGAWVKTHSGCLLIDRYRIIQLLDKHRFLFFQNPLVFAEEFKKLYFPLLQQVCPSLNIGNS